MRAEAARLQDHSCTSTPLTGFARDRTLQLNPQWHYVSGWNLPKKLFETRLQVSFSPHTVSETFYFIPISCQARKCPGWMGRRIDAAFQQPLPRWWCSASGCTSSSRRRTSLSGSRPGYCLAPALGQLAANRDALRTRFRCSMSSIVVAGGTHWSRKGT